MERNKMGETVRKFWERYKFVGLVILAGVILLVWPTGGKSGHAEVESTSADPADQELARTQAEMEQILSQIDGAGELRLMLTVESSSKKQLASDTELSYSGDTAAPEDYSRSSTVVVVSGDSGDEPVVTVNTGPVYRGALVVCQGADRADVKLAVTQAVAALTGLGSDRISVVKCQS